MHSSPLYSTLTNANYLFKRFQFRLNFLIKQINQAITICTIESFNQINRKNLVFLKESIIEMKAESSCWCAKPKIDFNLKIEWKGGQRHYSDVAMGFKTFTCQQVCRSLALTSLQTNFFLASMMPWIRISLKQTLLQPKHQNF